jgi:hypothetical protein
MTIFEKQKTYGVASGDHLAAGKNVMLSVPFSQKYPASGANALTDGKRGNHNLNENWQGFEGTDVEITIDLGEIKKIKSVKTSFLDSPNDWIFYPQKFKLSCLIKKVTKKSRRNDPSPRSFETKEL